MRTIGLLLLALAGCDGAPRRVSGPAAPTAAGELVLVARLIERPARVPGCGGLHIAEVMRYEVVHVEQGRYGEREIRVAVPCPELPRREYSPSQGTLERFDLDARHRLHLRRTWPDPGPAGPSAVAPTGQTYWWLMRADPA